MADKVNQRESLPELTSGGRALPEAEGLAPNPSAEAKITEMEGLLTQREEELSRATARLVELEQLVATKDGEITDLKQAQDGLEERLTVLNSSLTEAVASYKDVVLRSNPEVVEELISGDTVEAINKSLDRARALVSKVRQGLETEISLARVPAGAPERALPDLSALSPREKIQYAIGGFSS